jgi:hypothetical protein
MILWGTFGQLLLLGLVLREMALARVLAPEPAAALILLSKLLLLVVAIYAVITARTTVKQTAAPSPAPGVLPGAPLPKASMI